MNTKGDDNMKIKKMQQLKSILSLPKGIWMIAVTGGPCSGKTTGLAKLKPMLEELGYKVLVSSEVATVLINSGYTPSKVGLKRFQKMILVRTLLQEEGIIKRAIAIKNAHKKLSKKKVKEKGIVILCDRGAMDGQAYMSKDDFTYMVSEYDLSISDICQRRYHAVIHMRSTAVDAEKFYTLQNNSARMESVEEAREMDHATLCAWQSHQCLKMIDNNTDFDGKVQILSNEVRTIIGDSLPYEREEKFLIEPIALHDIPGHLAPKVVLIEQDYIDGTGSHRLEERRLRKVVDEHTIIYLHTVKKDISPGLRYEKEELISKSKYYRLLKKKNKKLKKIIKRRISFYYKNKKVEIDTYVKTPSANSLSQTKPSRHERKREMSGVCIMEIELAHMPSQSRSENPKFDEIHISDLPDFIKVKRKVTGEKEYSNKFLAGCENLIRD